MHEHAPVRRRRRRRRNDAGSLPIALVVAWIVVPPFVTASAALRDGYDPVPTFAAVWLLMLPLGAFGIWGVPRAPMSATIEEDAFTLQSRSTSLPIRWDAVSAIDIGRVITRVVSRDGTVRRLLVDAGITSGLRRVGRAHGIAVTDFFEPPKRRRGTPPPG